GRPLLVTRAWNTSSSTSTTFEYSDASRYVLTKSDLDSGRQKASIQRFDQLGRLRLQQLLEGGAPNPTDQTAAIITPYQYRYAADSRCAGGQGCEIETVQNPHRSGSPSDSSGGSTRTMKDQMGRPIEVRTNDSAGMLTGTTTYSYRAGAGAASLSG